MPSGAGGCRVLVVAGEASGDALGGGLVAAYRAAGGRAAFVGMGGPAMRAAGVDVRVEAATMAVMGAVEVLTHLPTIYRAYRTLVRLLDAADLVVLIDYPDFNFLLARAARRRGVPVFYYVSPQLWAWRAGRVKTLRERVDHLAVILPFEAPFYEAHGVPVTYVGHPLIDAPRPAEGRAATRRALGLDPALPAVALLPGSRRFEVTSLLPVLLAAAGRLASERARAGRPKLQFVLPLASTVPRTLVEPFLAGSPVPVTLVEGTSVAGEGAAARALAAADVACLASGTATLEAALAGIPMVVVYKVRPMTYALGRLLVRVPSIALVNIIAGRRLVPELIQGAATPEAVAREAAALLDAPARRAGVEAGLAEVRSWLGPPGASSRAAAILRRMLGEEPAAAGTVFPGADASRAEPLVGPASRGLPADTHRPQRLEGRWVPGEPRRPARAALPEGSSRPPEARPRRREPLASAGMPPDGRPCQSFPDWLPIGPGAAVVPAARGA